MVIMDEHELTYEKAIARIEEITRLLEGRGLPLEESLALFEEGVRLCRTCMNQLEAAEKRIELILLQDGAPRVGGNGKPLTEPFPESDPKNSPPHSSEDDQES